jgi:exodeoxyribonuclease VII small subunit
MPKGSEADQPHTQPEELDFEAALERLEAIVGELESGELGLEESLRRFEEATRLKDLCARKLREAEARVEEYTARAAEAQASEHLAEDPDAAEGQDTSEEESAPDLFSDL